jgi:hypothetical protein
MEVMLIFFMVIKAWESFSNYAEAYSGRFKQRKTLMGSYSSFTAGDIHFQDLDGNK